MYTYTVAITSELGRPHISIIQALRGHLDIYKYIYSFKGTKRYPQLHVHMYQYMYSYTYNYEYLLSTWI